MPDLPSRNSFRNRTLSHCAAEGMLVVMRCNHCRRTVQYWASDLIIVLGAAHQAHVPPWSCSKCRTKEYVVMRWRVPSAQEIGSGLTVRRPIQKVEKWIWRDERT